MPQVYALQLDIVWEDQPANHEQIEAMLEDNPPPNGALVILPELCDVGFSLNTAGFAEQVTGNVSESWCADLARRLGVFVQGASIQKQAGADLATNNAVVFNPQGEVVCRYHKVHPFSGGRESEAYKGGTTVATFSWLGMTVCPLICYDLRFPELWRLAAVDYGAEMFTIGASWPSARHDHWLRLLEARAIENQAYVVGVNRCGSDPYLSYLGGSKIVDPQGHIMVEADDQPQILHREIDPDAPAAWRSTFEALADTHRDLLGRIDLNNDPA